MIVFAKHSTFYNKILNNTRIYTIIYITSDHISKLLMEFSEHYFKLEFTRLILMFLMTSNQQSDQKAEDFSIYYFSNSL